MKSAQGRELKLKRSDKDGKKGRKEKMIRKRGKKEEKKVSKRLDVKFRLRHTIKIC